MSDVDLLRKKILNDNVIVPLLDGKGAEKKSAVLCEEETNTDFTVYGLPANSIVIKADKFPETRNFLKNAKGEASRADFIIISETETKKETKKWIIYIEMKKGNSSTNKKIVQQLKGAQCVMAYCISVVENFYDITEFLGQYKPRFISIRSPNVNKRPTRSRENEGEIHDTPENMLKFKNTPSSRLNKLVYK